MFSREENDIIDQIIINLTGYLVNSDDIEDAIAEIVLDEYEKQASNIDQENIHEVIVGHFKLTEAFDEE